MSRRQYEEERGLLARFGAPAAAVAVGAGVLAYAATRFRTAFPNEMLIKTGFGIADVTWAKKTVRWPFQTVSTVNLKPFNANMMIESMTKEKIKYLTPVTVTLGPCDPDKDAAGFRNYAQKSSNLSEAEILDIVTPVLQGECRVLAGKLGLEDLFSGRDKFRTDVVNLIEPALHLHGLRVYNCTIAEMLDPKSGPAEEKVFHYLAQRATQGIIATARVDVAQAKRDGTIGEKERERDTRVEVAKQEAVAIEAENTNQQHIAKSVAELKIKQAELDQITKVAQINSQYAAKQREMEQQRDLEVKKHEQQVAEIRADKMAKATIQAETVIKTADGEATAKRMVADADRYSEEQRAAGILAHYDAKADGLKKMFAATGGDSALVQFLLANESGLYGKLAQASADAIQGLKPKLTVYQMGGGGAASGDVTEPVSKVIKAMPVMMDLFKDHGVDVAQLLRGAAANGKKKSSESTTAGGLPAGFWDEVNKELRLSAK